MIGLTGAPCFTTVPGSDLNYPRYIYIYIYIIYIQTCSYMFILYIYIHRHHVRESASYHIRTVGPLCKLKGYLQPLGRAALLAVSSRAFAGACRAACGCSRLDES